MLDAEVIFSRVLHELVARLATELQLLTLIWSEELLEEATAALVERKPVAPEVASRWVGYLRDVARGGGAYEPAEAREGDGHPIEKARAARRAADPDLRNQARSKRSRFMTLAQAATKSSTNFAFASSLA